jgi:hypothetical protein
MLQVFQRHVASVSEDIASVCSKCFMCFRRLMQAFFYLDVAHVSHICCKSTFEVFKLFQSYVAISVFMLQVASVLSGCCIYFTHMLQVYILNVSFASDICCIQVFHVASVSCFRGMFKDSHYYNNLYGGGHFGFLEASKATASVQRPSLMRRPCCPPRLIKRKKKTPLTSPPSPSMRRCLHHPHRTARTAGSGLPLPGSGRPAPDLDAYRCIKPPSSGSGRTPPDLVARRRIHVDLPLELAEPASNPSEHAAPAASLRRWSLGYTR